MAAEPLTNAPRVNRYFAKRRLTRRRTHRRHAASPSNSSLSAFAPRCSFPGSPNALENDKVPGGASMTSFCHCRAGWVACLSQGEELASLAYIQRASADVQQQALARYVRVSHANASTSAGDGARFQAALLCWLSIHVYDIVLCNTSDATDVDIIAHHTTPSATGEVHRGRACCMQPRIDWSLARGDASTSFRKCAMADSSL